VSGPAAGQLRHRVQIEARVVTLNGTSPPTEDWQTVAQLWARIAPLNAVERLQADALRTRVTHRVMLRWRDDVTPGMRLVHRGRVFRIRAVVDPDERRAMLRLDCEEEEAP
jgi:SPP1 family predicted phage head-tail adaptor